MNVLFFTVFEVSPQNGGTERVTASVASTLSSFYGCECSSVYLLDIDKKFTRTEFAHKLKLPNYRGKIVVQMLHDFIVNNRIDCIINQGSFETCTTLRAAIDGLNTKLVLAHHFEPGWDEHFLSFNTVRNIKCDNIHGWLSFIKNFTLYPYRILTNHSQIVRNYRDGVRCADKVVLLSKSFIPQFCRYAGIETSNKFTAINNALSFDSSEIKVDLSQKKKEVLIVARLEEEQKRISLAIKIWNLIEKDETLQEWCLKIVGHGIDESLYRRLAADLNLKRLSFEGVQVPNTYYERASLFMMTSKSEGWGLTLTEAQQYGCIPFAFDSYASLHDIITDGENGCIIPYGDLDGYARRMKELMLNKKNYQIMAVKAMKSTERFDQSIIGKQWYKMLSSL